jgi:hypothetical protein
LKRGQLNMIYLLKNNLLSLGYRTNGDELKVVPST